MKNLLHTGLITLALMAAPTMGSAHGSMKPQHGGMVQMSGETMMELVTTPKGVDVYLSEEDEPLAAEGYTAKLTQTVAGEKSDATLTAAGGNRLSAPGLKPVKDAKLVVTLVDKGGNRIFATFQAQ